MVFGAASLMLVAAPAASAQGDALAADFDRIAQETAEVRGLPVETEITEAFLSPDELRERLASDFATDYPEEEIVADERALEAFGLAPEGIDLGTLVLDLLGEQVAGFYDPRTDEMFVVSDEAALDATAEFTYTHEVVHALQDQAFDLEQLQGGVEDGTNDDAALALTALIEGDATAASIEYLARHPLLAARLAVAAVVDSAQIDNAPPIVAQTLVFPYIGGQAFVAALLNEGGWDAVDAAYGDVPTSTEQILHPEKYLDEERDEPTAVSVPDLAAALGEGWSRAEENNFGEYQTAVVLADQEPGEGIGEALPEAAAAAAAGWDGDRYAVWANGEQDVVAWVSVWDDAEEAEEFAEAVEGFGEGLAEELGQELRVERDEATVRFVLAPTAGLADAALGALTAG